MKRIFLLSVSSQLNGKLTDWLKNQFPGWLFFDTLNTDEILPFPGKNKSIGVVGDKCFDNNTWENNHELLALAKEAGFTRILIADKELQASFGGYFDITLSSLLAEETIINIIEGISGIEKGEDPVKFSSPENEQDSILKSLHGVFFRRRNDPAMTMTLLSNLFESITGFTREDVISGSKIKFADLILPADYDFVIRKAKDAVNKNKSYHVEYRITCADSSVKWIWEQGRNVEIPGENGVMTEGFMFDITEKKLAEEEISRLLQAIEQNPNPVMFTNPEGIVVYANHGITNVTGYSPAEFTGRLINLLNPEKNEPENVKLIFNTLKEESDWQCEFYNWKKNGQRYWENAFLTPIKDKTGIITHFAYIIEDITKRKHIEKVLIEAKEKAEESDKLKTAFLSNMSHEIRIPMNAIIGFTEMLTEKDYSDEEKGKFIELVLENGRKLLSTIDDVIDIAKIEAGKLSLSTQRCSANKILFDNFYILRQMSQKLGKSHLNLMAEQYLPDQNMLFISDPQRINQVISNLMSNALKYTHEGFIELGYRLTTFRSAQHIEFYVKDSGTGIPSGQAEQIFDRFRRMDANQKSGFGGTGLGLAISRGLWVVKLSLKQSSTKVQPSVS